MISNGFPAGTAWLRDGVAMAFPEGFSPTGCCLQPFADTRERKAAESPMVAEKRIARGGERVWDKAGIEEDYCMVEKMKQVKSVYNLL